MSRPRSGWFEPRRRSLKPLNFQWLFVFMQEAIVYIIYSEKLDKFYIGKTENYAQRISFHNSDENEKWSKAGRPWTDFLIITCRDFKQAGKIERYIKAQKSRKYLISLKEQSVCVENLLKRFAHDC